MALWEVREVLVGIGDGHFVGMSAEEVLAEVAELGVEVYQQSEDFECGYIILGSLYMYHYDIEFDEYGVCDCSYYAECEE